MNFFSRKFNFNKQRTRKTMILQVFRDLDFKYLGLFKKYRLLYYLWIIFLVIINLQEEDFSWFSIVSSWYYITGGYALCLLIVPWLLIWVPRSFKYEVRTRKVRQEFKELADRMSGIKGTRHEKTEEYEVESLKYRRLVAFVSIWLTFFHISPQLFPWDWCIEENALTFLIEILTSTRTCYSY